MRVLQPNQPARQAIGHSVIIWRQTPITKNQYQFQQYQHIWEISISASQDRDSLGQAGSLHMSTQVAFSVLITMQLRSHLGRLSHSTEPARSRTWVNYTHSTLLPQQSLDRTAMWGTEPAFHWRCLVGQFDTCHQHMPLSILNLCEMNCYQLKRSCTHLTPQNRSPTMG